MDSDGGGSVYVCVWEGGGGGVGWGGMVGWVDVKFWAFAEGWVTKIDQARKMGEGDPN